MGLTRLAAIAGGHALDLTHGLATLALTFAATSLPGLHIAAACSAGAMARARTRSAALATFLALLASITLQDRGGIAPGLLTTTLLTAFAASPAVRFLPAILPQATGSFALLMLPASLCLIAGTVWPPALQHASTAASLLLFLFAAGLARKLDIERLRTWTDKSVVDFTRDLLLGRVTSGMLHDLAQPLNVISMANGNLEYLVDRLDIDPAAKTLLGERSERIAEQTGQAAHILGLFRWFGRNASRDDGTLTVRDAIEHAITATKSNIRHAGVDVELRGDALDCLLPERHASLELLVAAALLSSFEIFLEGDGAKVPGTVVVQASLLGVSIVITIHCLNDDGKPRGGKKMDEPTIWLIDQVARESQARFSHDRRYGRPVRFSIVIGSD